jgi:hypothetical protein
VQHTQRSGRAAPVCQRVEVKHSAGRQMQCTDDLHAVCVYVVAMRQGSCSGCRHMAYLKCARCY